MGATGFPHWVMASSAGQMGADENLHDYLEIGEPNALDSVTAGDFAKLAQSTSWIASVSPLFVLQVTGRESSALEPLVVAWSAVSGGVVQYTGDSPPSGFPSVVQSAPGAYTITAASSYNDDAGVSGDVAFRFPTASMQTSAAYASLLVTSVTTMTLTHKNWVSGLNASNLTSCVEVV